LSELDWRTSIYVALKFFKWYSIWFVSGLILQFLGFWLMAPIAIGYKFGSLAAGFALIVIGFILQLFGFLTTFFRMMYTLVCEASTYPIEHHAIEVEKVLKE
jgi:hypothetical protein